MNGWFEQRGLVAKILVSGVGAILVTVLLCIGVSVYFQEKSGRADEVRSLTNRVVAGLYKTRNLEKNVLLRDTMNEKFYASGNSDELVAYRNSLQELKKRIAGLVDVLGQEDRLAGRIRDVVDDYVGIFATLVEKCRALGFADWGATGEWHRASLEVQGLVQSSGQSKLVEDLIEILHAEREYLQLRDIGIAEQIGARVGRMREAADALAKPARVRLQAALDRYLATLAKHLALLKEIGANENLGLHAQYRAAANAVDPVAQELLEKAVAESELAHTRLYQANVGVALLGLVLGGLIFSSLSRTITRPLRLVTGVAEKIASGRVVLDQELEAGERRDEVGTLLESFRRMAASLRDRAEVAGRIAAGDLTMDLGEVREGDVLGGAFKTMIETLKIQVSEIKEGVGVLGVSAAEISAAVTQVVASATETATAVTQTMATAEELRQTSDLSAQKAGNVSKTATESVNRSREGLKAIELIAQSMGDIRSQMEAIGTSVVALSEQGQVIGEIIGTVDDLAEQSNILSVNASIEAAKAGEQGRGFAVVAQEIKSLAEKSKEGTSRVRAILADIQKATSAAVMVTERGSKAVETGVAKADEAARAIRSMAETIGNVDQAALQILASSRQQFSGVEQVTSAIENIREATEQNVKSMEQLETSAQTLADIGRRIVGLVGRYTV